jgi:hypothetical protein
MSHHTWPNWFFLYVETTIHFRNKSNPTFSLCIILLIYSNWVYLISPNWGLFLVIQSPHWGFYSEYLQLVLYDYHVLDLILTLCIDLGLESYGKIWANKVGRHQKARGYLLVTTDNFTILATRMAILVVSIKNCPFLMYHVQFKGCIQYYMCLF